MKTKVLKLWEWIFLFVAYTTMITFGIIYKNHVFMILSTLLGLLAAMLNMEAKKYCFFFYAVYVAIYGIFSFLGKQYGEGVLNLCYNLPLYLYTIYRLYYLEKKRGNEKEFKIKKLNKKQWLIIVILIPLITLVYGFILKYVKSALPFINALASVFAIIASFLASKTTKEQWIFWILYSAVLVYLWFYQFQQTGSNGLVYLILNMFYIVINTYGLIFWHRQYRRSVNQ